MDALNQLSQTGLVVEKLTKTFERGSVALKQADFSVDPGQMVALINQLYCDIYQVLWLQTLVAVQFE